MDTMLIDHFSRLLEDICSQEDVRAIEAGNQADAMWFGFAESGFTDALIAEKDGGAGLTLGEVLPLLQILGAHAVPLPIAETMVARALLARAKAHVPSGPILFVDLTVGYNDYVPAARSANHVLADIGDRLILVDMDDLGIQSSGIHGSLAASLSGIESATRSAEIDRPQNGLRPIAAVLRAAYIAGVGRRVLEMSVAYAGERIQFGKPIGKQQAIQQYLAVMAEHCVMADMAAQIGCSEGLDPSFEVAAVAKQIASAAAVEIANIAHAVHGAIGISEELDLQLLTRRLHEWRLADGSEGWWSQVLGEKRLLHPAELSADYIRSVGSHRAA